jgi:hypothetical protein
MFACMRCADYLRLVSVVLLLWACAFSAQAHKSSDAYLQLHNTAGLASLRVDVALRDLDVALDLDTNGDGQLTWSEVRLAWPAIDAYLRARVKLAGCPLTPVSHALEKRLDGVYVALTLQGPCSAAQPPDIHYSVMQELDPTHRGIARVDWANQASALHVLVPHPNPLLGQTSQPGAGDFVREGVEHIVTGYDHVLFLICLLLPSVVRRTPRGWEPVGSMRLALVPVVGIVTAFTVAHSITLAMAATGAVSLPPTLVEPAIALTIMLAALDNLWPIFRGKRVYVTFFFGLIHGFGFAGVLSELNLPVVDFVWALLQFNFGIEVGQLAIVSLVVVALFTLRNRTAYPAVALRGGSFLAMGLAGLWLVERVANVSLLSFS